MFQENPDVFLADFGVPCSSSGTSFTAIFDTPSEMIGLGHSDVVSNAYSILCKTADATAAAIASGSAVTVNGQLFTVRERLLEDDGVFTRFTLRK